MGNGRRRLERELRRREQRRLADLNKNDPQIFKSMLRITITTLCVILGIIVWFLAAERQAAMDVQAAVLRHHRITSVPPAEPMGFNAPEDTDWTPEAPEPETEAPTWESLGTYTLTFYCPCYSCSEGWGYQTASGATAVEGVTVAADPSIPFGTRLLIDGHEYVVQDRGGSIKGRKIDVFMESHRKCLKNGVQKTEIFIKR